MDDERGPVLPVNFDIFFAKNAIGTTLHGGEFKFELLKDDGGHVDFADNDATGLIKFNVTISQPGTYHYSVKEVDAPPGWETDGKEYPIIFEVYLNPAFSRLEVVVEYPEGAPGFKNRLRGEKCGLVEFPELEFDEPGDYEFTLKELTKSGNGWETDDGEIKVIVRVTDDGYGNLLAFAEYPEGFPEFTNKYTAKHANIILSACKFAVGAPLPPGRFEFGLYDTDGNLVSTARNS